MIMALRAPVLRSLQGKFLLLLVLGGTATAATAAWFTYRTTVAQLETQLEQRARLFANTVNHAAMVSTTSFAVQHVIEEVIGDEPDFLTVIVAAKRSSGPPDIIAAFDRARIDGNLDRVADPHAREDLAAAMERNSFGHHYHADSQKFLFIAPLGRNISEHGDRHGQASARDAQPRQSPGMKTGNHGSRVEMSSGGNEDLGGRSSSY